MAGADIYDLTTVASSFWTSTALYQPASGSTPASLQVGVVSTESCVLSGTVAEAGDEVSLQLPTGFETSIFAVSDTSDGALFSDASGTTYYYFSNTPLVEGATYWAMTGFGYFSNPVPCFGEGTLIRTQDGDVAVELIRPGDRVRTSVNREWSEVRWVGQRFLQCGFHLRPEAVWPICVRKGAFDESCPSKDLYLSPEHAVFWDGNLVPVRQLLNGVSILQIQAQFIRYFHIELDDHDVVLANNLWVESFLDVDNRSIFTSRSEARGRRPPRRSPRNRRGKTVACAPPLSDLRLLRLRTALHARIRVLGFAQTADAGLSLADGTRPTPYLWDGHLLRAHLLPDTRLLQLRSRTAIPCCSSPSSSDVRRLGVAVVKIRIGKTTLW